MDKYKIHPTFYATCCLLQVNARKLIKQAHEWSEEVITHDELNMLVQVHCFNGTLSALVWKYCVAVLTGEAEPMRYSDDTKGKETDTQAGEEGYEA